MCIRDSYGGEDATAPYAMLVYRPAQRRGTPRGTAHGDSISVDAACRRGVASFVNEANSPADINCKWLTQRDRSDPRNNKKVLKATKNVGHGDELLVEYGNVYEHANNENSTRYVSPAQLKRQRAARR